MPICHLSRLTITNFRNYREARLVLDASPVVLTGPNGSGKTNLLEAVSLFAPGRGLCRAAPSEWQNKQEDSPWAVVADVKTEMGEIKIATGRAPSAQATERRVVQIDGQPMRRQQILNEHVALVWVTPEMDRLLADGPSARRKLLDTMAYSFDPAHGGRVSRYEKALRERLRLFRDGVRDPVWLDGLEDEMARTGVAIAAARLHVLIRLQEAILETESVFPRAALGLQGLIEEALQDSPALLVEDQMRAALKNSRMEDAQTGSCAVGPHRSDLRVFHVEKNCPADLCSTGEQKALLVATMLAYARTLENARRMKPLLLLDDITAHLDSKRREALFEEILALGAQAWLTGTDEADFAPLLSAAQHFAVEQGTLQAASANPGARYR